MERIFEGESGRWPFDKDREIWSIKGINVWLVLDQKYSLKDETLVKIGEDIIKVNVGA